MLSPSPFRCFKTTTEIIHLAVMMYIRFPLSLRNVEDRLQERGIEITHETLRFWWKRLGPMFAAVIRCRRVDRMRASRLWRWHLDERYGTKTRDRTAALKFLRNALRRHGRPEAIVTDRLRSCGAALKELGRGDDLQRGRWANNRAENSRLPFRDESKPCSGSGGCEVCRN